MLSEDTTVRLVRDISSFPLSEPILQGYLRKEGASSSGSKKRWFVLRRERLDYMKRPDSIDPQGSIAVSEMLKITTDSSTYLEPFSFQIVTKGRTYAFQAPLEQAQHHWMSAIEAVMLICSSSAQGAMEAMPNVSSTPKIDPISSSSVHLLGAALDTLDLMSAHAAQSKLGASSLAVSLINESDHRLHAADLIVTNVPTVIALQRKGSEGFESGEVSMLTGHSGFLSSEMGGFITRNNSSDEGTGVPYVPGGDTTSANQLLPKSFESHEAVAPAKRGLVSASTTRQHSSSLSSETGSTKVRVPNLQGSALPQRSMLTSSVVSKRPSTVPVPRGVVTTVPFEPRNRHSNPNRLAATLVGNNHPPSHRHRLAYAKMWVNSLGVAEPLPVDAEAPVAERFKNGTLFCAILEACGEASRLGRTYRRPGVRATCLHNNEAVLAVLRLAGLPQRRLPTADELCNGLERHITSVLVDLLDLYALRPARNHGAAALLWLSGVLDAYGFRTSCLVRGSLSKDAPVGLWMLIRDGAAMALLAHYYGGDAAAGGGVNLVGVTLLPDCAAQRMGNLGVAAPVLAHLGVRFIINDDVLSIAREDTTDSVLLDADDDIALLQVHMLYEALALRLACALPIVPGGPFASRIDAQRARVRVFGSKSGAVLSSIVDSSVGQQMPMDAVIGSHLDIERGDNEDALQSSKMGTLHVPLPSAPFLHREESVAVPLVMATPRVLPQTLQAKPALDLIIREFERLFQLATSRAGSRASSAAVIELARRWAETKTRQWALSVAGFNEDDVDAVFQVPAQDLHVKPLEINQTVHSVADVEGAVRVLLPMPALSQLLPMPALSQQHWQQPSHDIPPFSDETQSTASPVVSMLQVSASSCAFANRRGSGASAGSSVSSTGSLLPAIMHWQRQPGQTRPVVKPALGHSFRVLPGGAIEELVPQATPSAAPVARHAQEFPAQHVGAILPDVVSPPPYSLPLSEEQSAQNRAALIPSVETDLQHFLSPLPEFYSAVGDSSKNDGPVHVLEISTPADEPLQRGRKGDDLDACGCMKKEEEQSWQNVVLRSLRAGSNIVLPTSDLFAIATQTRALLRLPPTAPNNVFALSEVQQLNSNFKAPSSAPPVLTFAQNDPDTSQHLSVDRPLRHAAHVSVASMAAFTTPPPPRGVYAVHMQSRLVHVGLLPEPSISLPDNAALCWSEPGAWPHAFGNVKLSDVSAVHLRAATPTGQYMLQLRISPTRLPVAALCSGGLLVIELTPADSSDGAAAALRELAGHVSALHGRLLLAILAVGGISSPISRNTNNCKSPTSSSFPSPATTMAASWRLQEPNQEEIQQRITTVAFSSAPTGLSSTATRLLAARGISGAETGALSQILSARHATGIGSRR